MLQELLVLATAAVAGLAVTQAAGHVSFGPAPSRRLAGYLAPADTTAAETSRAARLDRALGLVPEQYARYLQCGAAGGPAGLLLLLGLPLVLALGAGALGYVLVDAFLKGRWRKARLSIESEIPTFVSRLGGQLLVTSSTEKALQEVTVTLNDDSLLRLWMEQLLAGLHMEGSRFLGAARERALAITPLLGLVVYEIGRLHETGGTGFAEAFATTAEEISAILEARSVASAKAEAARQAVLMMLGIMGGILILMLSSANVRAGFDDPLVQMVTLGSLGAMAFGYTYLNGMINDALEA